MLPDRKLSFNDMAEAGAPDLPLGLGMGLAQSPKALHTYANLSNERKAALVQYIQNRRNGAEAQQVVDSAIERLGAADTGFF